MAIVQILVVTLLAEAVIYALLKASSPSDMFRKWLTISVYLVVFTLSQTGLFAVCGVKIYGYADYVLTAVICSVGSDGVKTLIANLVAAQQNKPTTGGQS